MITDLKQFDNFRLTKSNRHAKTSLLGCLSFSTIKTKCGVCKGYF